MKQGGLGVEMESGRVRRGGNGEGSWRGETERLERVDT